MSGEKKSEKPLQPYYERFQKSMEAAKKSGEWYRTWTKPASSSGDEDPDLTEDYSDLLRWEWAASVSALDKLTHDLIYAEMIRIFERKPKAQTYQKFAQFYRDALKNNNQWMFEKDAFKEYVISRSKHTTASYERMEMLAEAFTLICPDIFKSQPEHMREDKQKLAWYLFKQMPEDVRAHIQEAHTPYREALEQETIEALERERMNEAQEKKRAAQNERKKAETEWRYMAAAGYEAHADEREKSAKTKMDAAKAQKEQFQLKAVRAYIQYHDETIIRRRNQIVHQSDFPNDKSNRDEIDPESADETWAYISALGKALYEALEPPAASPLTKHAPDDDYDFPE